MVDLFFLKTFVSVAKFSSFRVAAERNFITQPAVSQHIRILEQKFKSKLFERQGKRISLTAAGKIFLPCAENILKQYEEAKIQIGEINNKYTGTIRIATIYSIGLHELQKKLRSFLRKYPQVDIHLEYCHNNTIYEMILNRTIDFGLVAFPRKTPGIISKQFSDDNLVLIQSPHHPVINKKTISLKNLNYEKFIAFAHNTPTGKIIHKLLRKENVLPKIVHEYDNIETLKSAVQIGMGCAIVPKSTVAQELKTKTLEMIKVTDLSLTRPLGILHPEGKTFTKSSKTFYAMMTNTS
ncbi:hypothetical protein MNBD_UNCLBAC01-1079 [hydrothermal vent metagenome]|uniref:HTH lysR-type domain-containing protein n=1 Tax=hydrothermal vent metagenome TaxID=652676 RepID=A0A3B1DF10_9ZZZZ